MMSEKVSCSNCGALAAKDDSFCATCGRRIRSEDTVDAPNLTTASNVEVGNHSVPDGEHGSQSDIKSGALYAEYDSRKLTVLTGYAAGAIGFSIGLHRLYARKPLWWLYLILFILGAIGSLLLVGFVFFGVMFIWWIVDMALMKQWVENHNSDLRRQIFNWAREGERHPHSSWEKRVD
ncbi:zinc ribbon domain-containing protein [Streptomyces sp. SP17KL33]|uniref:zinc ribbon domain-containing protein n=1 Tax=Streptomyces sp. SP17KL33 TaxID=3002534 RepID=UPI002E7930B8|nr:zinc ribbon domain-containing protein [Streptomyces sp. SP17KL33]MEE1829416.1 zinc ribbon domain-containing protein [Streptomyces sp. SP17KL33]